MTKNNVLLLVLLGALTFGMWFCAPKETPIAEQQFLNLHDSVGYVGMQMCRSCHANVYDTYIHTGMGQSFGKADLLKTAAEFNESALVYDADLDYYYQPFFQDSIFYILEFRLEGSDTVHRRLERVDYIIGSGHHTNSHLINRNGYVYQAPITYYTQEKRWDLAPGFEGGNSKRFSRAILSECLTCHNHTPTPAFGAANKYHEVPLGIECERCHGAGALHVQEKLMGKRVDTSKHIDYSIVNPRHLSIERQMDLCQRCHLQGVAVLNEGKSFYDFKPGMALSEVMNVYLPRFTNSDKRFIMASQADRLRQSDCFTVSQQLSCITCHNPHHDVHSTLENNYNTACQSCHQDGSTTSQLFDCSASVSSRAQVGDDCVQCHMPPSGSIDIPHVNITDHYISRNNIKSLAGDSLSEERVEEIAGFLGLQSLVVKNPSPLEMARGYLALWDKFMGEPAILDSANYYLQRSKASSQEKFSTLAHYYFNKKEYQLLRSIAPPAGSIRDAWSAYRVGEAANRGKNLQVALPYFKRATDLQPYNLEFQEKYGSVQAQLGQLKAAEKTFRFILREQPQRKVALANLGLVLAQKGQITAALQHYDRALQLDPDYRSALLNKIGLLVQLNRKEEAQGAVQQLLNKHPETKALLQQQGILQ
jgi:tetratricopeptide (TPR) repeat protein